eukprot:245914_1
MSTVMNLSVKLSVILMNLMIIITLTFSDGSTSRNTKQNQNGQFAGLFTYNEYKSMKQKRIRKEIRDISNTQWKRIANAMNLMKYIPTESGHTIFGDNFINYDGLVCQHHRATYHIGGDMAHIGPQFNIWHRAYILAFENSLIAIDHKIDG